MITLRGSRERDDTKQVEEFLQTHSFRYRWENAPRGRPPELEDRDFRAVGEDEIAAKEDELVAYKEQWDKFQTDACYIEEDGEVW
ncbi:MAG: hypothetical protein ACLFP6_11880 [Spirochaetaceae bacterium]